MDHRRLILPDKLDALDRGICPLVKLSRKEFYREDPIAFFFWKFFQIEPVHRRLRENSPAGLLKSIFRQILHIVADQHPHAGHASQSQITLDLVLQFLCLHGKSRLFLHVHSSYHTHRFSSI